MRKDNLALLALFLLTIMAFSLVPVRAFIYPDGSVDGLNEDFGPRLDRIQVIMYDGLDAMWTGLQNGEIDVTDWPLTATWLTTFISPPYDSIVQVTSYGGDAGMYLVDFNLNNNYWLGNPPGSPAGYVNPVSQGPGNATQNVCSDLNFRRGVNYLFNRTLFQTIIAGWGVMIYTPVPSYMGSPNPGEGTVNQDIRPGGALEALTYPYNPAAADAAFAAGNIKVVAGQNGDKRFWDRDMDNICDAGEEIVLNINSRQDTGQRKAIEWLDAELVAHGFVTDTQYITGGQNYQETMLDKNYHMATLDWINLGPDPDFLYDLYHVNSYWHSLDSACPNTQFLNDPITNYWAQRIKFNITAEGARLSAWEFQERFATLAAQIPLFSNDGYKAHSRTYVGGTPEEAAYVGDTWLGLCNQMGFGDNGWYTFENAHPDGHEFSSGDMTIRYGWKETGYPQLINPLYSESYWDREVLSKVYDTLGHRDPYDLSEWKPYLVQNWTVGTWVDGAETKSSVEITLRPDIYFSNGVQMTVHDVIYSLTQSAQDLVNKGYPPPWWWPTAAQVQSAYILDPYRVMILFKKQSNLAESWALGGFYIIPKHIWKPIIDSGNPTAFAPDPNVTGSGPWKYVSMQAGVSLLMVANKPSDHLLGVLQSSPGVFNYYPIDIQVYEQSYGSRFLPGSNLVFKVRLENMWTGRPVTVNSFVSIYKRAPPPPYSNAALNPSFVRIESALYGITLAPSVPYVETFTVDNSFAGKIEINVTITYQTAPFVGVRITVILDPWITMREDITGGLYGQLNYLVPDGRVDGRDISVAASAFGTKPGQLRWIPVCDVTGDFKCDGKDIARMAKNFGWNWFY